MIATRRMAYNSSARRILATVMVPFLIATIWPRLACAETETFRLPAAGNQEQLVQLAERSVEPGQSHVFRSAGGAAALSLVVPGAGQIYNGQWPKAFFIWLALGVTAGATLLAQDAYQRSRPAQRGFFQGYAVGIMLGAAIYIYGAVDAYTTAENINFGLREQQRRRTGAGPRLPPVTIHLGPDGAGVAYRATF